MLLSKAQGSDQMNVFIETDNPAAGEREHLILDHLRQVKLIARRIHDRLPGNVSLDDLVSAGMLGLIAAIDRFDASRDVDEFMATWWRQVDPRSSLRNRPAGSTPASRPPSGVVESDQIVAIGVASSP